MEGRELASSMCCLIYMYTYSLLRAERRVGYNSPTRQPKQRQPKNNNVDDGDGGDR